MIENIVGIADKTGPAHRRRLRAMIRQAERELLDSTQGAT